MVDSQHDLHGAGEDNVAVALDDTSSESSEDDDDDLTTDGGVSLAIASIRNEENAKFGNIAVTNSTDVHFGNKTFYQGPVTIKQFVYASKDPQHSPEDCFPSECVSKDVVVAPPVYRQDRQLGANGIYPGTDVTPSPKSPAIGCLRRQCVVVATLGAVLFLAVLGLATFLMTRKQAGLLSGTTAELCLTKVAPVPSDNVRILSRNNWLAQPPSGEMDVLTLPVPYVIISHTATEGCWDQASCVRRIRDIQTLHIESNGWSDIGYNFLIGGDNYVYTGRGWDTVGAHSFGYNICSIGISFIGTYNSEHPTADQLKSLELLIAEGVRLCKIHPKYRLIAHRQVSFTLSPGDALYADLTTLPHFTQTVEKCANVTLE